MYILTNPAMPGLVKIGHTARPPQVRAAELTASTGVPAPFHVAWAHTVSDHSALEGIVHGQLAHCRTNGRREFFCCSVPEARGIIEREAAALLLPWWRAWLHRLRYSHPHSRRAKTGSSQRHRRGDPTGSIILLGSVLFAVVATAHPSWVPAGIGRTLQQLMARLPHF